MADMYCLEYDCPLRDYCAILCDMERLHVQNVHRQTTTFKFLIMR
jgi:hypothetical protein